MYCVMRASVPSLYNVYRRYDRIVGKLGVEMNLCTIMQLTASGLMRDEIFYQVGLNIDIKRNV